MCYHVHVTFDGEGFSVMFQHDERLERDHIVEEAIHRELIDHNDVPDVDLVEQVPQDVFDQFNDNWVVRVMA